MNRAPAINHAPAASAERVSVIICAAGKGARAGFSENKLLRPCPPPPFSGKDSGETFPTGEEKERENNRLISHLGSALPLSYRENEEIFDHVSAPAFASSFAPVSVPVTVLEKTISAFDFEGIAQIIVTSSEADFAEISSICKKFPRTETVIGGSTRFHSVYGALGAVKGDIVLVHDGARPFIDKKTILGCIASVLQYGSGICAVPATDTIALTDEGLTGEGLTDGGLTGEGKKILSVPPRENAYAVQTPQGFRFEELFSAYKQANEGGREAFTDDSSVYAAYIRAPRICEGSRKNKKLTYAEDFSAPPSSASALNNECVRVGFGVDTHAFGKEQDYITLGGVKIPSESGLIAHSDGDVLIHALMDGLLSAAGLKDIGHYFPDKDDKWKGANSMQMLAEVKSLIGRAGYAAKNVSIAIQAEKPRLAAYIDLMKQALSSALDLPLDAVGISAGTNEGLGYIGEGKGITVHAYVLLKQR